jgi:hypothetical protein
MVGRIPGIQGHACVLHFTPPRLALSLVITSQLEHNYIDFIVR